MKICKITINITKILYSIKTYFNVFKMYLHEKRRIKYSLLNTFLFSFSIYVISLKLCHFFTKML